MTDITELAHGNSLRKKLNRRLNDAYGFQRTSGGKHTTISLSIAECKSVIAALDERLALVESLEKAQAKNALVAGGIEATAKLHERIAELESIREAAEKLVRCKGRYHSEQNYRALAALFGVKTPDLPPLEHENVHYADAAEMEIAALRQRIADLESRTVTVKLPEPFKLAKSSSGLRYYYADEVDAAITAAGIKVEAE
ncbi:ead/Ea22-like family protein [Klebsiella quasipneumoniae]|uniref:ead/Ea22-like family protein n=1 Tax=Klebsiella quasipneumoniae TaxID=1463165 RepID=UPI00352AA3B2